MPEERNVAIVGGGIGGLSAAYFLHGLTSEGGSYVYRCTVFEKEQHLGGNCHTAYFDSLYLTRFADLAVNDFNLATYTIMGEVLERLAADGFPVETGALTDQACFFTTGQDVAAGFPDIAFTTQDLLDPQTPVTRDIARDKDKFEALAERIMCDPRYATMTVGEFLALPELGFSGAFRDYFIFPRINGMYFMGETVPADMPVRGVMSYYILQEGIGLPPEKQSDRRYFTCGSTDWIRQLYGALAKRGVRFCLGESPTVRVTGDPPRPRVESSLGDHIRWDHVISAVYADEVPEVIEKGLPPEMPALLGRFRYINSIAIAHTYEPVMPPMSLRKTYNIRIFPPAAQLLRPYTISYVERMHQGAQRPEGSWFVSENPPVPIPDDHILEMIDLNTGARRKAVAYFRHNTVSLGTMEAQQQLIGLQGKNEIYYTGGWTRGAGLHEEILFNSQCVALRIRGFGIDEVLHCDRAADPDYVPKYILDALSADETQAFPRGFWE